MTREPECIPAFFAELDAVAGADRILDACVASLQHELSDLRKDEGQARRTVERLALVMSASLLVRYSSHDVADAFIITRLAASWSGQFGGLPTNIDASRIARSAVPA